MTGDVPGCVPISVLLSDDGSAFPKNGPSFDPRTQIALLPFSSGTTGLPKGVMLSHYNMVANTLQTEYNDTLSVVIIIVDAVVIIINVL